MWEEKFFLREFSQVALLLGVTHPYAKIKSSPAGRRSPPGACRFFLSRALLSVPGRGSILQLTSPDSTIESLARRSNLGHTWCRWCRLCPSPRFLFFFY